MAMIWTLGAGVTVGDIVCQQFGPDSSPVSKVEDLGEGRIRLHHEDGTTSRTRVDTNVRIRRGKAPQ